MRRIAYREKIRNLLVFVQDTTCFVTGGTGVLFCSVRMLLTFDRLRARERRGETGGESGGERDRGRERESETARVRREREREERAPMARCQIRSDYFRSNPDTILEPEKREKRKQKKTQKLKEYP